MTRLLLTLLALLTGLVAQIAPVQARISGAAEAEVAVQLQSVSKRVTIVSQAPSRPIAGSAWVLVPSQKFTPQLEASIPAVLTGIDRARE